MSFTGPQPPASDGTPISRRWRDLAVLGVLFALMIFGLIGVAAATGWEEVKAQLSALSFVEVLILLALSLCNYVFRGMRWHLLARRLGIPVGLIASQRHFLGGFAMSVTPGRLGELVRMRWIRRETGWSYERSAALALADRSADMATMAMLLAVAAALSTFGGGQAVVAIAIALGGAILATRPSVLSWGTTLIYRVIGHWPRNFARLRAAARSMGVFSHPVVLTMALLLGGVGWAAEGVAFWLLLAWMGADVSVWTAIAIFCFSTIAGNVTGAPGGLGGAEAAMVALLALEGVPLETSLAATAVIRVTTLWFAIGIGLAVFPIAERASNRVRNGLEN